MTAPPTKLNLISVILTLEKTEKRGVSRNTPYPPNFNKIAANTIEPATGASTWALGSHRWTEKRGYFTMKPAKRPRAQPEPNRLFMLFVVLSFKRSVKLAI
jgi:hypothetical protein